MLTFEQKYEKMKKSVINSIGEDEFNRIKTKIYYSRETDCFYLCKSGGEHQYQFYNANNDHLTDGFKESIVSAYTK